MTATTTTLTRLRAPALLAALLIACTLAWRANAGARPPATPTAVATIDIVAILDQLEERQVLEERLQASLNERQKQLEELGKRLENVQADIQTLNQQTPAYREKVREALELRNLAQTRRQILEQIISIERAELLRSLYDKISASIGRVADRDGWDVVLLDDSAFPLPQGDVSDRDIERNIVSRGVIYRHDSVDITSDVIQLMNNEFNAP
ncbi:MAG: OmpH family outer membrane protein [Phycisphaerales bacterium JB040]